MLELPLDALAVRKVGHPWQPEYAIGAVAPGNGVYVRASDGLTEEEVAAAVDAAKVKAVILDRRLMRSSGRSISPGNHPCSSTTGWRQARR